MNPPGIAGQLTRIEKAIAALSLRLARIESALAAGPADDDGWTRLPRPKDRCKVSGWSRSTILRHIAAGKVRSKSIRSSRFYSAADVKALLAKAGG
jgi:hypothetical protein